MATRGLWSQFFALLCSVLLVSSNFPLTAQDAERIPNDQLDSLVAPIALYPDPLLAQVLAASTYPLEIIQLQQFLSRNKDLKDKALTDAVMQQPWDPSVQALAPLPDVVKRLSDDIQWTTDLGNAFLAQESDVMDAVQRMRMKAEKSGNLKSTDQMKVETKVVESKTVVVIQQANPQVIYVPSYNPTVVYGPPVYPYPPIYYPPPSYYAAGMAISFGVGLAMGAAWGGGWGWNCGWGRNNVNINVNNTYVNNYNRTNVNNKIGTGNGNWQHNPQHRGGTPYSDRGTANRYGGTARGESMSNRQTQARQNQGNRQQGGAGGGNRTGAGGTAGSRPSQGQPGVSNRASGGAGTGGANRSATGGSRPSQGQPGASNRASGGASNGGANRGAGSTGGGDRIGNRSVPPSTSGGSRGSALGGASSGTSGSSARESGSRGASSMGASGGGGSRGGGGGGGGSRSGGASKSGGRGK